MAAGGRNGDALDDRVGFGGFWAPVANADDDRVAGGNLFFDLEQGLRLLPG